MRRVLLAVVLLLAVAFPAAAQQPLTMRFQDGLVSLDATAVPVRSILTEWSRLGGTKIVNAEGISGAPVTLKLVDMPEARALEVILRSVAGYMAAPRVAANGASIYDRILVMPTSATAPAAAAGRTAPAADARQGGFPRFGAPVDGAPQEAVADPGVNEPPVFQFPQPGQQPNVFQPVGQPTPFGTPMSPGLMMGADGQAPQTITINPQVQQPGVFQFPAPAPAGGFGVVGAPTPGMIQQPLQPGQTTPVIRPPGK